MHVVPLRRLDADEAQRPLEHELDEILRFSDDVRMARTCHQGVQRSPADARPLQIVPRDPVRRHSVTTSPGFQSGFRSQYS